MVTTGRPRARASHLQVFGELTDGDSQHSLSLVSEDGHPHGPPGSSLSDKRPQVCRVLDRRAVVGGDDITTLELCFGCRTILHHVRDQSTLVAGRIKLVSEFRGDLLDRHTQPASDHFAVFDQAVHHGLHHVRGNGEADPHVAAATREDRRVDADQLSFEVDQRTTGIPGVDGRIGLNEILIVDNAHVRAPDGADDPKRDGLV